jgi:hypothetical protein
MALTKIDLCNHALLKVGADTIASLDTNPDASEGINRKAALCNILFDQALEEILRSYTWNCVTKRAKLTRLSEKPSFKWDYQYQLPGDFCRLINLYDNVNAYDDGTEWVIEGNSVLCDHEEVYITYTHIPEDISILDPLAAQAVICKLAIKLCVPLQLDESMANNILQELLGVVMPAARSIDTFENKEYSSPESQFLLARNNTSPII